MLDRERAEELRGREVADGFIQPDYGGYCFAGVPGTATSVLDANPGVPTLPEDVLAGVETPDVQNVVVLFVDALGFEQFERTMDGNRLLRRFADKGRVTPLTSVYPSETAACVTTMHTGSLPVEHGLLGWNAYDPAGDAVYEALPYAAKDGGEVSVAPEDLFDGDPIYPALGAAGVDPHVVEPRFDSGYSEAALRDATTHHYETTAGFALRVRDVLRDADGPTYCYAYYPSVDTVAHHHGTRGDDHAFQVAEVCDALDRALATLDDATADETLVLLVADHGQVNVGEARVDLAETDALDRVPSDRSGAPLVLGGPRNVHLRTDDPAATRDALGDLDALVLDRADALDADLWGSGDPGDAFERNCGDLVVVPRDGLVWHGGEPDELAYAGMHGGLDPAEALVPFAAARLADLR